MTDLKENRAGLAATGLPKTLGRRQKLRVNRLEIRSLAVMVGAIHTLVGLALGAVFTCIALLEPVSSAAGGSGILQLVFAPGSVVFLPCALGLLGASAGAILALVYNALASLIGGIRIEAEF